MKILKENINILTNHKAVEVKGKNLICEFNNKNVLNLMKFYLPWSKS